MINYKWEYAHFSIMESKDMSKGAIKMEKKGITGSTLKLIAVVTMFIDHIGAVILERMLSDNGMLLYRMYLLTRFIGRIAFPIFCFLLVEGFIYTSSRRKYALRLFAFAIISEIPFDLATRGTLTNFNSQNVYFTLFIGLLVMCGLEAAKNRFEHAGQRTLYGAYVALAVAGCALAYVLKTDYSWCGVLAIVIMYYYKEEKQKSMFYGTIILIIQSVMEAFALINIIFIRKYNGERGLSLKYVFYLFYPMHLLILYAIACFMGLVA